MFNVADFMTRSPVTVEPETDLRRALEMLRHHRIQHLCVVLDSAFVGVLSERDILSVAPSRRSEEGDFLSILARYRVSDVMSAQPRIAHPTMKVWDAAQCMTEIGAHCIPIVESGRLLGIFTSSDCVRAFLVYVERQRGHRSARSWREPVASAVAAQAVE